MVFEPEKLPKPPAGKKWVKCVYPPCQGAALVEDEPVTPLITPKPKERMLPMCQMHGELTMFLMWLLPRVQVQRGMTEAGLVLPGSPAAKTPPPKVKL